MYKLIEFVRYIEITRIDRILLFIQTAIKLLFLSLIITSL